MTHAEVEFITIGYGNRKPAELVELCWGEGVVTVVDVRLRPDRAWSAKFARSKDPAKGIAGLFGAADMGYVSLPELGNLFDDGRDGVVRYSVFLDRAGDLLMDRLDAISGPIALLCAERRVAECHRGALAKFLVDRSGRLPSVPRYRLLGHIE